MEWALKNKFALLWAFLWFVGLFFYFPFVTDAGYLPKLLGFSVISLTSLLIIRSEEKIQKNGSMIFLALIIFSSIPSLFVSENFGDGTLVLVRWVIVFVLVALFSIDHATFNLREFAVKASSLALLFLSIWGVGEWILSLDDFVLTHKATYSVSTSLGHRNLYVQFLALLIPLSAVGLSNRKHWRILSLIAILLSIFLLVVLLNRTAWFTLIVYALAVSFILWKFKARLSDDRKKLLRIISVFTLLSLVAAFLLVDELYTFLHHFETLFDFSRGTSRDRVLLAQRSFELFKEHPLFGIGAGMWKIAVMGFSQDGMLTDSANVFYQRPHNDYLWVLSESGAVAGFSFIVLHVLGVVSAVRVWLSEKNILNFAILLSWLGFIIASLTSFPIERPEYLLFFAMLLALTFKNQAARNTRLWKSLLIVASVIITLVLIVRIDGERNYMKAKSAQTTSSWNESEEWMKASQNAFFQVDALSLPLDHHAALAQFKLGQIDSAAIGFKKALRINPYHPETWNNLGICAVNKNNLDSALICFNRAVRFTTSYQDAWLNIAIIQYNQGLWRTSIRSFLKADSAQSTENYEQLGTLLAIDSLTRMLLKVPDHKMMKTLEAFRNTPEWAFSIIQKCASNDIPFDQQAYIDACFFMLKHCEEYEDCDLVDQIIDQYLPGGMADLNLTEE